MDIIVLYAKQGDKSRFFAFNLSKNTKACRIVKATRVYRSRMEETKARLQEIANNRNLGITFQFRYKGKVLWQSE